VRARVSGDQIFVEARIALLGGILREVGNERRLQRVTIEEHQVGDLVFVLLPLFIHVAEGHIDLISYRMTQPSTTTTSRGVEIGERQKLIERYRTSADHVRDKEVVGYELPRRMYARESQQVNMKITMIWTAWGVSYYGGEEVRRD
jgi:hypothetical protein